MLETLRRRLAWLVIGILVLISAGLIASTGTDENALLVTGGNVTVTDSKLVRESADSTGGDSASFYGVGAAALVTGGTLTMENTEISTDAEGGAGVFACGSGVATVKNTVISTRRGTSGGIHVAGGTLYAENLTVTTEDALSAAIRSDRGGGTVNVDGGTYTTNGTGSPAIYSTAQIAVTNAVLTANRSEAIVVEGRNSVTLTDCTVSGNMQGTYGPDSGENLHGVMLYQSMSGDAQEGQSLFRMTGGELTTLSGDLFYVTNTDCAIELSGVALTLADGCLLRVEGNTGERGWGTPGENGGRCTLNAIAQALSGTIRVDESSSLDMTLSDGATFEGTVNPEGQGGEVNVTLAQGCRWTLTADAYVTSFTGDLSCVETNGYTLYTAQEKPVAGV